MAQMYRFERDGVVKLAKLAKLNEKAKLATLELEDGTIKSVAISTFKRWWKKVEDESLAGDGTPLAEVGKEIAEQAKQKAESAKKKDDVKPEVKKEKKQEKKAEKKQKENVSAIDVDALKKIAITIAHKIGFEEKLYDNLPNIVVFKIDGKGKAEVRFSRKGFVINVKEEVMEEGNDYKKINNYYLPAALSYTGYSEYEKELEKMLNATVKWYGSKKKEEVNDEKES